MVKKRCHKCEIEKDVSLFNKNKSTKDGYTSQCKECYRSWHKNNPEKSKEQSKQWRNNHPKRTIGFYLKSKYNITLKDYNTLFEQQNGYCAICGTHQTNFKLRFAVDHNHRTGEVRGLLCFKCNWILGRTNDNINVFKNAISYLEKYATK